MTRRIPLFPLPGVVLLPGTLLPLHVFEPRYRAMVADALSGARTIGMAFLKDGWELAGPVPPVHEVGGAGEIVESERLDDGRYNIVLEGRFRYRILEESPPDPYRVALVEELPALPFPTEDARREAERVARELFGRLAQTMGLPPLPDVALSSERLTSELAIRLRFDPDELRALLETDSLEERVAALVGRMSGLQARIDLLAPYRPTEIDAGRN